MTQTTLPHATASERVTLGSILLDPEVLIELAAWLKPEHFYHERHTKIYAAMLACYERRSAPVLTSVAEELRQRGELDAIGDVPYLVELSNEIVAAYHVLDPARAVHDTATRRRGIDAARKMTRLFYDETTPIDQVLSQVDHTLTEAIECRNLKTSHPLSAVISEYYDYLMRIEDRRAAGEDLTFIGLPSGFLDLDRMTGGLQKSDLLILAARPGVGKSALAMSIAFNIVMQQRQPVGVFALEMGREQLLQRLLATHTGIDSQRLRTGRIATSELTVLVDAMGQMESAPLYIDDTPGLSIADLKARARRMQAEFGLSLLIIDYLQLMSGSGRRGDNRVQEVSEISRGLKLLAKELNIPVIALSQLSRAVEGRTSHVPTLADLRESGSIENDADIVMFIYREELYDRDTDKKGIAELHIAKHRNGPLGVVPLFFDQRTTKFMDLAPFEAPVGY